jgi:hypothetical protein
MGERDELHASLHRLRRGHLDQVAKPKRCGPCAKTEALDYSRWNYRAHREELLEYHRKRYAENRDQILAQRAAKRAKATQ